MPKYYCVINYKRDEGREGSVRVARAVTSFSVGICASVDGGRGVVFSFHLTGFRFFFVNLLNFVFFAFFFFLVELLHALLSPRLLDKVDLGAGYGRGRHEATVFRADKGQVALGCVGAILGRLQFSLESAHPGYALLGHALLLLQLPLVDVDLLRRLVESLLQQSNVLRVLLDLDHHFLDVALLLAQDLHRFRVSALLLVQLELEIADLS